MRTAVDIVDIVYQLIRKDELTNIISGWVYRKRPSNSRKEDVVVNCLPISGDDIQLAVANVNIHVPNMQLELNQGVQLQDSSQPNTVKLNEIQSVVVSLIQAAEFDDIELSIQAISGPIEEEQFNEHFINIRIQIFSPNI